MEQHLEHVLPQTLSPLVDLITDHLRQMADVQGLTVPEPVSSDTALFGGEGFLDSMALVTLVVAVEQAIEETFNATVSLTDARALSQEHSPFRTIGALAEYAYQLMQGG